MLEGAKAIWSYIREKSGFPITQEAVEKAMRRRRDPVPYEHFNGRNYARREVLDKWIEKMKSPRRRRRAA